MFVLTSKLGTSDLVRTLTWVSTGEGKQVIETTRIKKKNTNVGEYQVHLLSLVWLLKGRDE